MTIVANPALASERIDNRRQRVTSPAVLTLSRRRLALSISTPREFFVPLLAPLLFALIIAPALATMVAGGASSDYRTYVSIGTAGLLVPIACMFAGISVITDRDSGARRELLTAPVPRSLIVVANLLVAIGVSMVQLVVLFGATLLRGAHFHTTATGICWFVAAALLLSATMYSIAEILSNRASSQEAYVGAVPAVAIVPWFVAGSLFPISALPVGLTAIAKVLPLTHVLALMRYGLLDRHASGLHEIWGMSNATVMAALSLGVVACYAALLATVAFAVFRKAVQR